MRDGGSRVRTTKRAKKESKKPEGSLVAWVCSDVSERALVCERAEDRDGVLTFPFPPNLLDIS